MHEVYSPEFNLIKKPLQVYWIVVPVGVVEVFFMKQKFLQILFPHLFPHLLPQLFPH